MRAPSFSRLLHRYLPLAGLTTMLAGCAGDPLQHADAVASQAAMRREEVSTGPFVLTTYVRAQPHAAVLRVYIEGDGRAWLSRTRVSPDPTPHEAMGLQLAASDGEADLLYLARPCQFTPMARNPACRPAYWTDLRYAPEVVDAMDAALSQYVARLRPTRLELVGYSGGGAVAVLLAARRRDVAAIRTVAGNLDHAAVNRWHQVSPMPDSLNPIDVAPQVSHIPQRHFSGADDRVVPTAIARDFVARAAPCAALQVLPDMGHESDWPARWPTLLRAPLPCTGERSPDRQR
jgi:hypothetical protein